ncbi:hypothetical protein D3C78_1424010 [compost metagenome]
MVMLPPWAVVKVPATTDRLSPSRSVSLASSCTLPVSTLSSAVLAASSTATGASLTGVTVTSTVAVSLPPLPSLTV